MHCPICSEGSLIEFRAIDGVQFYECDGCGSLTADPAFLGDVENGRVKNYETDYWKMENMAARERSYGSSPSRVAELFLYSRNAIRKFVDIGSGPGHLLDSLSMLMPESADIFHAVEMFPPEHGYRTSHPNYMAGSIGQAPHTFDAGTCIEVIEHLTPSMLNGMVKQLSTKASNGAIFYFGSGQPSYVRNEDPAYLDPHVRGHIISYSLKALEAIFGKYGFVITPLPGRTWAFLAEFGVSAPASADELMNRIWSPHPENVSRLRDKTLGPLMYSMGIEAARCYLEAALSDSRAQWALGLDVEVSNLKEELATTKQELSAAYADISNKRSTTDASAGGNDDEHVAIGVSDRNIIEQSHGSISRTSNVR